MTEEQTVCITGKVIAVGAKAVLMEVGAEGGRRVWIPLSIVVNGTEDLHKGYISDLEIQAWFARKEQLS